MEYMPYQLSLDPTSGGMHCGSTQRKTSLPLCIARVHWVPHRRGATGVVGGPPEKEKRRLLDLLDAIAFLKDHGLRGVGVIRVYHARRVAPLMACVLPLYRMAPDA